MSKLQAFFADNVNKDITTKAVISERFKDEKGKLIPFEFKAVDRTVEKEIKKSCTRIPRNKKGINQPEFDWDTYIEKFVAASITFPNLKDAELQKSWGVIGEINLLRVMLLPGEFTEASNTAQEISGYDKDINELVEEAKN
ncbi:phage tail assembly chaperone [Vallitalea sp.]|jgi:hypothetical protein|uniref:phage tail assembly chaperone n=1 Tax=Vallitalea sp. TaxID=1882829 RepID=UPI0025EDAAEC|nr:phage portal protein [Vallitalea sp.]MCT4686085.1 phage portal protein [Vallitalea sp.]